MPEKQTFFQKYGTVIAIVVSIYAVIRLVTIFYPAFVEGMEAGSKSNASETRRLIEQGAMAMTIELELDDPKTVVSVTTVFADIQQSLAFMTNGPTPAQEAFILEEAGQLLAQCDDSAASEKLACVEAIDFTLPPYPGP